MNSSNLVIAVAVGLLLGSAAALGEMAVNADIQSSGKGYSGVVMINQAAGTDQQQVNARALAIGDRAEIRIKVEQTRDIIAEEHLLLDASAQIRGDSFSQGNGVLGVNQSAGSGNQQINAFRIEFGSMPESLDDGGLAQSVAPSSINSGAEAPQSGRRVISIDDQAFADSRGVVQLNQSAGAGNRMVNSLGIRIMD
ncbi:adhesin [Halopseudomonas pelagia]|uniref:adhesin n=1 Tax=Halopseudomonas pelagia TaxID=553151 RepID=UPI0030DCE4A0|tara:strand:+ start:166 stop:753 length:588 start_codon:yes stop_codon:yes gene_type:complete